MENKEEWELTSEEIQEVTLEEIKFIFDQAEKLLGETTAKNDIIVTRTTTLLAVVIGIISALIGFSIKQWDDNNYFDSLIFSSCVGIAYLLIVCYYFYPNIKGTHYYDLGNEPKIMLNKKAFEPSDIIREKRVYLKEVYRYQNRITHNNSVNIERWKLLRTSMQILILFPLVLGLTYIISTILFF